MQNKWFVDNIKRYFYNLIIILVTSLMLPIANILLPIMAICGIDFDKFFYELDKHKLKQKETKQLNE